MKEPLRILHLDCTMGRGGQERDHLNEAAEFRRQGHLYMIAARPGTFLHQEASSLKMGISVPFRSNFDIKSFMIVRRFLQKNRIDILVTTSYIDSVLGWFVALSMRQNRPLVIRQRHILNPPKRLLPYRYFCDFLVSVSDIARFGYIERKIPFWKVFSLPRGIPVPDQNKEPSSENTPTFPENSRIILQIGTFQRDKGQLSLLEGLRPFLEKDPHLHLVLLGDGPLRKNIERRVSGETYRTVRSQIHIPGWCDPNPLYRQAAVTVISSFREAFSLVALESLYHGVPIVGFRQGGLQEISLWAEWGELVDPWNIHLLCQKAIEWALRPELSCPHLDRIRKIFHERYSIESSVNRTEKFYRWAITRKKIGRSDINPYALIGGRGDPFYPKRENDSIE